MNTLPAYVVLNKKTMTKSVFFLVQTNTNGDVIQSPATKGQFDYYSAIDGRKCHMIMYDNLVILADHGYDFMVDYANGQGLVEFKKI